MDRARLATMTEATRLVREGRLEEAATLLQRGETGLGAPPPPPVSHVGHRARDLLGDLFSRLRSNRRPGPEWRTPTEPGPQSPGRLLEGSYANGAGHREYRLYVPSSYKGRRLPMIVMLHGGTQSADDFAAGTRMNELAERHRFLVVYPEQSALANPRRYWNWFQPSDQQRGKGEPSLIAGLTSQIIADHAVETARVYLAGFSAGAAMAAVMAACYPDLYAAVGVHSGLAYGAANDVGSAFKAMKQGAPVGSLPDAGRVPLIVFQGDADPTVDQVNAQCLVEARLRAAGRERARYRTSTTTEQVPDGRRYTRTVFTGVKRIPYVEQWIIHGAGHAWSGGSPRGSYTDPLGPDASAELLRFFKHHANATSGSQQDAA
jgi:poly(hydroxyalkanoate) depolymerase family esterase